MFKDKVLEAHHERLYGNVEDHSSSDQESDSNNPGYHVSKHIQSDSSTYLAHEESVSLHSVHKTFLKRQIKQSAKYHHSMRELPQTVSSKRKLDASLTEADIAAPSNKSFRRSEKSSDESSLVRGQRMVSVQEKNKRRKEKKKRAREKKSMVTSEQTI